jgi:hypothetical protein
MVQLGAPNNPAMNIFVPFTKVQPWTLVAMLWYLQHTTFVDVSGDDWDYVKFFEQRWAERKTFISVEHDVVPGPGVLDSMWGCSEPWCVSTYIGPPPPPPSVAPFFGVIKFTTDLMQALPKIWWDYRNGAHTEFVKKYEKCAPGWKCLDVYFHEYVLERDLFAPHHHWPLAVHGGKNADDALYPPVRVTDPDGNWLREHELSASKTIELTLNTL